MKRCWICRRSNKEVYDELVALQHKGVWKAGHPDNKLVEKAEDDSLDNISLCVICRFMIESLADRIVDGRTHEDLLTEKDINRIKVSLEIDPDANNEDE